ncbi:NADH dehydrogenase (ubiquinone) complex I, assembly factor 6 [Sesamum angolense]|uniref:NADH dehydrogenase (Ubiquinone) complex I, assembly factor 6 n=1 Tax=Sesamum angolense TaxID=2727404 RepID=A0AAE1T652_9LAMI|nr:NADH dehydrogenase (ubiquinone) complex I, assembly factor 6 [Sesamum angolense]
MSGASTSTGVRTAFSYCVQQVRSYDYHHYLCLLELPPNMRKSAFALRAFNVETARAMDIASDPRIGLMRLLWWQEAIDKIFSKKIKDAKREVSDIPETVEELERYAEDTMSTILYSTLQAGGISRNRHFPYIPVEVAEKHGLLVKDQGGQPEIRIDSREGLCNAVFEMASVANSHLEKPVHWLERCLLRLIQSCCQLYQLRGSSFVVPVETEMVFMETEILKTVICEANFPVMGNFPFMMRFHVQEKFEE